MDKLIVRGYTATHGIYADGRWQFDKVLARGQCVCKVLLRRLSRQPTATDPHKAKWCRKWSEVTAYKLQIKIGYSKNVSYHSNKFAVDALMNKQGLGMSEKEAKKVLGL